MIRSIVALLISCMLIDVSYSFKGFNCKRCIRIHHSNTISKDRLRLRNVCYSNTNSGDNRVEATSMTSFPSQPISLFSSEILAIFTVYFVQGALGLSSLAVSFFLKDELHLSPSEVAALVGVTALPWLIKPLYGFLSDTIPIYGYKRRSYLFLSGIMGCISWILLGTYARTVPVAIASILLGSASVAISDVVVDSIVVEKSRLYTNNGGDLQSYCWGASSVGGILSAYFSGFLLESITPREIFIITSFFPLFVTIVSIFINEAKQIPADDSNGNRSIIINIRKQITDLKDAFLKPEIYLPVLFIFLWRATPSPDTALFYFTTNSLGFKPEFLGKIRLLSNVASLVGVFIYNTYLKNKSIKSIVLWASLISVPLSLTQILLTSRYNLQLGIPDEAFALTDTVVLTVLGQIAFMPTLVLAASLCPPGVEGALFATLMSIYNGAGVISGELGGLLTSFVGVTDTNFENLSLLVLICSLASLLPLPFINMLEKATITTTASVDVSKED